MAPSVLPAAIEGLIFCNIMYHGLVVNTTLINRKLIRQIHSLNGRIILVVDIVVFEGGLWWWLVWNWSISLCHYLTKDSIYQVSETCAWEKTSVLSLRFLVVKDKFHKYFISLKTFI